MFKWEKVVENKSRPIYVIHYSMKGKCTYLLYKPRVHQSHPLLDDLQEMPPISCMLMSHLLNHLLTYLLTY